VELRPGVGAPEAVSEAEVEVLSESESSQTGEAAGSSSSRRLSERFEELEECRKRGILTDEEYAQKRAELMACF